MKHLCLIMAISLCSITLAAFECSPYGPVADELHCALLDEVTEAYGARVGDSEVLILLENGEYNQYTYYAQGLPISGLCWRDANTLMVSMGAGTYSDGVYNFDLTTHQWTINEWFFHPHFITRSPDNLKYYVGERDGLYTSGNGEDWYRETDMPQDDCRSMACYGQHIVCNVGNSVYISSDAGIQWQQAGMGLLEKFRFTDDGVLYGIMDDLSDSDGLWRSYDFGQSWELVFYASSLSCVGPDFGEIIPVAFHETDGRDNYLALLDADDVLTFLAHEDLQSSIQEIGLFPLVNTPSFYVINDTGFYFITGFIPIGNEDQLAPAPDASALKVYPNPATKDCRVSVSDGACISELKIYNLRGQLLRTIRQSAKELAWDLCDDRETPLPAGIYLLRAATADHKRTATTRLMIK